MSRFSEENEQFFTNYFWENDETVGNSLAADYVCPFTGASKKYYWKKAYKEYLDHTNVIDTAAKAAGAAFLFSALYRNKPELFHNAAHLMCSFFKPKKSTGCVIKADKHSEKNSLVGAVSIILGGWRVRPHPTKHLLMH